MTDQANWHGRGERRFFFWREEPVLQIRVYMGDGMYFTLWETARAFRGKVSDALASSRFIEIVDEDGKRVALNPQQMVYAEWKESGRTEADDGAEGEGG